MDTGVWIILDVTFSNEGFSRIYKSWNRHIVSQFWRVEKTFLGSHSYCGDLLLALCLVFCAQHNFFSSFFSCLFHIFSFHLVHNSVCQISCEYYHFFLCNFWEQFVKVFFGGQWITSSCIYSKQFFFQKDFQCSISTSVFCAIFYSFFSASVATFFCQFLNFFSCIFQLQQSVSTHIKTSVFFAKNWFSSKHSKRFCIWHNLFFLRHVSQKNSISFVYDTTFIISRVSAQKNNFLMQPSKAHKVYLRTFACIPPIVVKESHSDHSISEQKMSSLFWTSKFKNSYIYGKICLSSNSVSFKWRLLHFYKNSLIRVDVKTQNLTVR